MNQPTTTTRREGESTASAVGSPSVCPLNQLQSSYMGEWLWAVGSFSPLGKIDVPWVIVGVLSCLARALL